MDQKEIDRNTLTTVLQNFNKFNGPRYNKIQQRLEAGEPLGDTDLLFFERVIEDGKAVMQIVERNPEYKGLAAKSIELINSILRQAIENEERLQDLRK